MREYQWKRLKKRANVSAYVKSLKLVQPKRQLTFDKILESVKNGTLYGFLIVDIHTASRLLIQRKI